ncbi:MAG TPA: serine/threonine-protein kinase, partial [Enhygromyxa sp.]|nr:serine/threonine-protein kinase [Enhygromyxa sp.]
MSDSERLPPGRLIADRYRVGEIVGRGAMGIVYAGEHVRVGRRVAIKVLTRAWSNEASVRQRFEAEARAASAAGHPNVIQVLDVGELPDQRLYLVMEFVDGRDLNSLLWAEGPLSLARACRLVRDTAFAVRAAHARGVIHRDLKLENVMVQSLPEGEVVKVLDFGIAAGVVTATQRATAAGMALGTPETMAPEQVDGKPPTVSFDIYALGVMLFELLTKRLPIEAEHPLMLMAIKQHQVAPRVASLRPEVSPALDQLIADSLEIDPSRRPPSCDAFLVRLNEVIATLADVPTKTRATMPSAPPPRPSRLTRPYVERGGTHGAVASVRVAGRQSERSPVLWLLAGIGVAAAVGVGLFLSARPSEEAVAADAPAPQLPVHEPTIEPAASKPEPAPV